MRKTTRTTSKSILDFPKYSLRTALNEGVKLEYGLISARGTGLPEMTIERHLKLLRERGAVSFRGAPKTGGYYAKAGEE